MAMVRKCDLCSTIEGVEHYTVRWESGAGQADLCPKHAAPMTSILQPDRTPARRPTTGKRRGPALTKVTTLEEIEAMKGKAK